MLCVRAETRTAFATPNSSNGLDWDSGATSTLQTLVSSAHNSGYDTQVVLSIGESWETSGIGRPMLTWTDQVVGAGAIGSRK